MALLRSLTLIWPGMPWLWLRGSRSGLALAVAFAVIIDVAIVTTWIWSELVGIGVTIGFWTGAAAIWVIATASAVAAFPTPIPRQRSGAADALFLKARDAYLARDWTAAESHLHDLLAIAPTDGEAQLLRATLLRRLGRLADARAALAPLAASDSGVPWRAEIDRELSLTDPARRSQAGSDEAEAATILPLRPAAADDGSHEVAA
ncbi:MAG: tetratricopeptide repeat protein [Planctomycetia bacterium]|jgi:hypothetical protein